MEQQLKHNDCGISVVKIIYDLHRIPVSRNYIEENIHLTESGSSFSDIKDFLNSENFETEYNLIDLNSLKSNPEKLNRLTPCILPIKNNQGHHYVVVSEISNKKIHILDPARGISQKWSMSELMNNAHIATTNYDLVTNMTVIDHIISEELSTYGLAPEDFRDHNKAEIINKLTYFSYVNENFGFIDHEAERAFLRDLLLNQELSMLPKQFRALKVDLGKLKIQTPVVLTVKKKQDVSPPSPDTVTEKEKEKKISPYVRLFNELSQYHSIWGIYIVSAVIAAFLAQVTVFSSQILIDKVLPDFNLHLLILFVIGLAVFRIFSLVLSLYKSYIGIHLANILDNFFLSSFIEKLNALSIRYIQSYSKGDLSERIKDSLVLKAFFIRFFTNILIDGFVAIYALCILFIIDWRVTLIIIAVLSVFVVWFRIVTPYIRDNEQRRFKEKSNLFSSLFENIDGLQVIKSFRLENLFRQRIAPRVTSILNIQKKVRYVNLVNGAIIELILIAAGILIMIFLSYRGITTNSITIGQIITYMLLSNEIFSSISGILQENLDIQENEIILARYFDFGRAENKIKAAPRHALIKHFEIDTLEFRNVSFHYVPQKPVFTDLNITIQKGDKINLQGMNGTGKSTFCKILSLLYAPDSGSICINNEKQIFYNPAELRKKILLVTNEDILFNDTLGYNISFSHNGDAAEILALAKQIGMSDFIASLSDGLDYVINEQGRNLSTGQRKKILLMRALLSPAEIIIMDETLSGIDQESRSSIEKLINKQTGRSFIIISHEPLYELNFSKTLIMQDGRVRELQYEKV